MLALAMLPGVLAIIAGIPLDASTLPTLSASASVAASMSAYAPCPPLDLPALEALADARSDEIHIREADLLSAEADRAIARAVGILPLSSVTFLTGPDPEAHGSILMSTNTNRSLRGLGPFARVDVSLIQPIWTWGQLDAVKEAGAEGAEARAQLINDMRQQIHARVIALYYTILLTQRLLSIADEVDSNLGGVEKHVQSSLKAGSGEITIEDKYRVAIFRSELEQKRAEANKALKMAKSALAATLASRFALPLKDATLPKDPHVDMPEVSELVAFAQKNRPDLLALEDAIRAKEALAKSARRGALPQVFLGGTFTYARAPNRDIQLNPWISDPFNQLSFGVALGLRQNLSLPLLLAQAEKAGTEVVQLQRQQDGLIRLVQVEVERAAVDLEAAAKRHVAARAAVSAGKSWFRASGMNFGLNVTDAKSLLEAYTGYVKTQIDEAQSIFEVLVAQGRLDQVVATPVPRGTLLCPNL